MKKILAVIIGCFLCVILMISCSREKNPFFIVDVSNDLQNVVIDNNLSITQYDSRAEANVQVNFDNKKYDCIYVKTYKRANMSKSIMQYKTNEGQVILIEADSGDFAGINFITPQYYLTQPYVQDVSLEELETIKENAKKVLSEYIDLSNYQMEEYIVDTYIDNSPNATPIVIYKIHYYKDIDGFQTTESANIVYDSKGNILEFSIIDKGVFDNDIITNRISEIDELKINSCLDLKVEAICKDININEYIYEVEKTIISTDNNGSPILIVYVNIFYKDGLTSKIAVATNI